MFLSYLNSKHVDQVIGRVVNKTRTRGSSAKVPVAWPS